MEIKLQLNKAEPTLYTFKEVAELLDIKGLGRNKLMKFLRDIGDLRYDNEINIEGGYYKYKYPYKAIGFVQTVLATDKGLERIKEITMKKRMIKNHTRYDKKQQNDRNFKYNEK